MYRFLRRMCLGAFLAMCLAMPFFGQQVLTWQQVRDRFIANNPALKAGQIGVEESRADEVTAFLRPNPNATISADQLNLFQAHPYRPLYDAFPSLGFDYLHERQHKRELRLESAHAATEIAASNQSDLQRSLGFGLRDAFVRTLGAKAVLRLAEDNLAYYDRLLAVNNERFKAGDIAKVDLARLQLQRVQFDSDLITARVNLRTAKVQLLQILNDRTPVDKFDVAGEFDFNPDVLPLEEFRKIALDARPDLRAAFQSVEKARTDHRLAEANGSTDPTFGVSFARNPPLDYYIGFSVSVPLRIFDRNQGEKRRTDLDIGRTERLRESTETSVLGDVDSSYATLLSTLELLKPYKSVYLKQAADVRETVSFAYSHGAASLLDFLDAQKEYRDIQLNFLNLVASYLAAANQLNLSVGREVVQ